MGKTKVHHLGDIRTRLSLEDKNIRWLEISMYNAFTCQLMFGLQNTDQATYCYSEGQQELSLFRCKYQAGRASSDVVRPEDLQISPYLHTVTFQTPTQARLPHRKEYPSLCRATQ